MLKQYGNLIEELLQNIFNGKTEASFLDCIRIAGSGILLMVIFVFLLAVIAGIFYLPRKGYAAFTKQQMVTVNELLHTKLDDRSVLDKAIKALNQRRFVFWLGFIVFYIPICIPTILYIISLLCY